MATLASLLARVAPGLRFNEHMDEKDGPLVFQHADRARRHRVEAEGLGLSFGPFTGLDQEQKSCFAYYLPVNGATINRATSWIFVLNIPCQQNSENESVLNNYARFQSTK